MKKFLIVLASLFLLIIIAAVAIPIIFKDDIKAAIDEELAKSVNADIIFDIDDFSISLLSNFPNLTVEINNFGVVNRAPFEGKKLVGVEGLEVEVNLKSILIDGDMRLKGITLNRPEVFISVLEDGTANYDITIASGDSVVVKEETTTKVASKFAFAIDHWAINDAHVVYNDATLPFMLELKHLTHTGSGTFSDVLFDLTTKTTVDTVNVAFGGVEYVSNKELDIDLILAISDNYSKYTFKDNNIRVNQFSLGFDGYFAMLAGGFDMDLTYTSKDNSFKSIFSLVPGAYMEGFEAIETAGSLSFGGAVKGLFNDNQMPAFNLNLAVDNGMFHYPDLPTSATDINIKTTIDNKDGVINNTVLHISKFHVKLGDNPFDATLLATNLDDVNWDLNVGGKVDLANIGKIMPLDGMTLAGLIDMDVVSKGKLSLVEAEQYDQLTTEGSLSINKLAYTDKSLTYDVAINKANMSFDPQAIKLNNFDAQIGKSDVQMTGNISNYIAYALDSGQVLKGRVDFSSNMLDLDEFVPEEVETKSASEEIEESAKTDTTALEVIPIPRDIDFTLDTKINTVKVMDMTITNAKGEVVVRDGVANLNGLSFNMLGGQFIANGSYNTQNVQKPAYDMKLGIKDLSIAESFKTFSVVKKYAPLAKNMIGDVSTDFEISGLLGNDYMPDYTSINAAGLLKIAQAAIEKPKFLADLASVTKLSSSASSENVSFKDVLMSATIKDGELSVKPFDINIGNYKTKVSGVSSVDGRLDYKMDMEIPAGALGSQVNSFLSQYTGSGNTSSTIKLPIAIGGTYDNPTYKLQSGGAKAQATDLVKDVVKEKIGVNLDEEKEKQREKIMVEAQQQADKIKEEAKRAADDLRKEGYAQADKLIKEAGSNFLKKKLAEEAAKKLKSETDKKAQKLEDEGKKRADNLLAKAQEKAEGL